MQINLSDIPAGINQVEELFMYCFYLINNFNNRQINLRLVNSDTGLAYDAATPIARETNVIDNLNKGYIVVQVAIKRKEDRDIVPRYAWKQVERIDEGSAVIMPNAYKNSQVT